MHLLRTVKTGRQTAADWMARLITRNAAQPHFGDRAAARYFAGDNRFTPVVQAKAK